MSAKCGEIIAHMINMESRAFACAINQREMRQCARVNACNLVRWQRDEAVALGADLGAAAILLEEEPGGNPFDEACAGPWWKLREALAREGPVPLACFATTVELRGQADVNDDYAAADAAALLRFLQRRGVVAGEPGSMPWKTDCTSSTVRQ